MVVAVSGPDRRYYRRLRQRYALHRRVRVIHTPSPGATAGRRVGLRQARDLVIFLDQQDYLTRGYLSRLIAAMTPEVELVCGRVVDEVAGSRNADTAVNRALAASPADGLTTDYLGAAGLFTTVAGKLFRTEFVTHRYGEFDGEPLDDQDDRFWASAFGELTLPLACLPARGKEALIRPRDPAPRGPSRPPMAERIRIVQDLEARVFDPRLSLNHKRFLLVLLDGQTERLASLFGSLQGVDRDRARHALLGADLSLLNTSFLADVRGVAFCHNFPPFSDASAYVAAKRLPQVAGLVGRPVAWDVVSADLMPFRQRDPLFDEFYARYRYRRRTMVPGRTFFNERAQHSWADQALALSGDEPAAVIYSRSMFAGSHEAAYHYKQAHPDAVWYAEFSDPISLDTTGGSRPATRAYEADEAWLNDYWRRVEHYVFEAGDQIIFTNANQREVMLGCAGPSVAGRARERSIVLPHPRLDHRWANVVRADYPLDPDRVNVGYFGGFYANRTSERLLSLLDDERVCLHLFVPDPTSTDVQPHPRVKVHQAVDHLRFLAIGKSMDYLALNDIRYPGPVNPYVPSKLADYLATGTPVLALVEPGSVLSEMQDSSVIAIGAHESLAGRLRSPTR